MISYEKDYRIFQYRESMITDLINKTIQARKARGITQRELSQMSGVSYSTLTKLEAGIIKSPSFAAIYKITKALDMTFDELIENRG